MTKLHLTGRALMAVLALSAVMSLQKVAAQIAVDELELFMKPDGTRPRTASIRVTNPTDRPQQVNVELQDWDRDDAGANRFHALGTITQSCGAKLKIFPMTLRIEAGRTEVVRVSYEGGAADACWAIVFMQGSDPAQAIQQRSSITYIVRTGVKVYVEPDNAKRLGDVDDVKLVTIKEAPRAGSADSVAVQNIEVAFRNSGTAHVKTRGVIEIRSADNQEVAKLDILEFPTVPGARRRVLVPLPALKPGRYVALALLDYDGDEIAAGQLEFEVK